MTETTREDWFQWALTFGHWMVQIAQHDRGLFKVLPFRCIVERTSAWLCRYRRLTRDYEVLPETSETMIQFAMINLMLHRLCPERKWKKKPIYTQRHK